MNPQIIPTLKGEHRIECSPFKCACTFHFSSYNRNEYLFLLCDRLKIIIYQR